MSVIRLICLVMSMYSGYIILVATMALVFMRAIQQLNVMHGHKKMAAATSYLIAAFAVIEVVEVVGYGYKSILWAGTGGAIGVVSAMTVHKKLRELLK